MRKVAAVREEKKKLLAIVDDWERLERYEDRLHHLFDFHSSPFGGHGVEMAIEHRPDIIILDLEFEDMNEQEALSLIRAQDSLQHAQIILVTNSETLTASPKTHIFSRPAPLESIHLFLRSLEP
jgi:CheY-like chemotaxis protein